MAPSTEAGAASAFGARAGGQRPEAWPPQEAAGRGSPGGGRCPGGARPAAQVPAAADGSPGRGRAGPEPAPPAGARPRRAGTPPAREPRRCLGLGVGGGVAAGVCRRARPAPSSPHSRLIAPPPPPPHSPATGVGSEHRVRRRGIVAPRPDAGRRPPRQHPGVGAIDLDASHHRAFFSCQLLQT